MEYATVPKQIHFDELWSKSSLSPSLYQRVDCPNRNVRKVGELTEKPVRGQEVGSKSYVESSDYYFIRNRALQETSCLLYIDSESIIPIKPKAFVDYNLSKNDILYSKDSNIGECCIIESEKYKNHMISSGILKFVSIENPLYLLAFLKHGFLKAQLRSMTARGSTISHSKLKILECVIPFPSGSEADNIVKMVESLMKLIILKEVEIREKNLQIYNIIQEEIDQNQKESVSKYEFPNFSELVDKGRLDTGLYERRYKGFVFKIRNYKYGCETISKMGFKIRRGQNLQISAIGKSIYSDNPCEGYYRLILPTNISDYGVVEKIEYLGNKNDLDMLVEGDIMFGAEATFRATILCGLETDRTISNIHAILLNKENVNIEENIFVGCYLRYMGKIGIMDEIAVGGHGGSVTQDYVLQIPVPKFPSDLKNKIANLYYNQAVDEEQEPTKELGVVQLNDRRLKLIRRLNKLLDNIIQTN
jgi:hypothetical protein